MLISLPCSPPGGANRSESSGKLKELETELEGMRQLARNALVEFTVLDPELSRFAVVNAEGEDAVITALCAPLDPRGC